MRKLYLLLLALLVCMPVNADVYLAGTMNSWNSSSSSWKFTDCGDGYFFFAYTGTLSTTDEFKLVYNGQWVGIGDGGSTITPATLYQSSTGNNLKVSKAVTNPIIVFCSGDWKISVSGENIVDYYLIGAFNGWAAKDSNTKFTNNGDGTYTLNYKGTLSNTGTGDTGFKINDGTWNNHAANFGGVTTMVSGTTYTMKPGAASTNMTLKTSITNPTITFNPTKRTLLIEEPKITYPDDLAMYVSQNWSNGGTKKTKTSVSSDGKTFTFEGVHLAANETFLFNSKTGLTGTGYTTYAEYVPSPVKDENIPLGAMTAGDSVTKNGKKGNYGVWSATTAGTYTITVTFSDDTQDAFTMTATCTAVDTVVSENEIPTALYLHLNTGVDTYDTPIKMTAGDNNTFTVSNITLTGGQAFLFSSNDGATTSEAIAANNGRFAAPVSATTGVKVCVLDENDKKTFTSTEGVRSQENGSWQCAMTGTYEITVKFTSADAYTLTLTRKAAYDGKLYISYGNDASESTSSLTAVWGEQMVEIEPGIWQSAVIHKPSGDNAWFRISKESYDSQSEVTSNAQLWVTSASTGSNYTWSSSTAQSVEWKTTTSCHKESTSYVGSINSKTWTYLITVDASDSENMTMKVELVDDCWYFYGDMNRWSIGWHDCGHAITIKDSSKTDRTADAFPDVVPNYYSAYELYKNWRFINVEEAGVTLPSACSTHASDKSKWYVLDFTNLADQDGNVGILCGQFKAIDGSYADQICLDAGTTPTTDTGLKPDQIYNAKWLTDGANIWLRNNYIDNAKLYFYRGATPSFYVEGEAKNLYTYYIGPNDPAVGGTADTRTTPDATGRAFGDMSQVNYSYETATYLDGNWEKVTNVTSPTGTVWPQAWRKQIPPSASHRYPIELNLTVKGQSGEALPYTRIQCDDIWYIERSVDVYFRYENQARMDKVAWVDWTAFKKNYDTAGIETTPTYLWGTYDAPLYSATKKVEANSEEISNESQKSYAWFKSVNKVPMTYASGAYAQFTVSDGITYPFNTYKASDADLAEAALQGDDLYYVVPESNSSADLQLLYTHINGSYDTSMRGPWQCNAELFDSKGNLCTLLDETQYQFTITKQGATEAYATQAFSNVPYIELATGFTEAGFYDIKVEAQRNGNYYVAYDVYSVYAASNDTDDTTEDANMAAADASIKASVPSTLYIYFNYYNGGNAPSYSGTIDSSANTATFSNVTITQYSQFGFTTTSGSSTGTCYGASTGNADPTSNTTLVSTNSLSNYFQVQTAFTGDIVLNFTNMTITLTSIGDTGGGSTGGDTGDNDDTTDVSYDRVVPSHDAASTVPTLGQLTPYMMNEFTYANQTLTASWTSTTTNGVISWAKYYSSKDVDVYNKTSQSDNETILSHTSKAGDDTSTWKCMNFDDAYYRAYYEAAAGHTTIRTMSINPSAKARVARTILVDNNTTDAEQIENDKVVDSEDANAPVVWYNLQGMRVANPSHGAYIRVQGKTATKVYVK